MMAGNLVGRSMSHQHTYRHSISSSPRTTPSSSRSPDAPMSSFRFNIPSLPPESPVSDITDSTKSEQSDDVVPKIEEIEDDRMRIDRIEIASSAPATTPVPARKRRGRPPRPRVPSPINREGEREIKGRSKTGCITCRKRKKKCDERKPGCEHCEKNNVVCEGYPPKDIWKSGKQKAAESARRRSVIAPELPPLMHGVETDMDRKFFNHFTNHVCEVLSLFKSDHNPFKEILLPMAFQHLGLMHALLCLSGSHIIVKKSLEPIDQVEERRAHHYDRAISILRRDENMARSISGDRSALIDDPTSASVLILCLETITSGQVDGQYRHHMDAARHLIRTQQSPNSAFQHFLAEFFIYHDVSNSVTSRDRKSVLMMDDFQLPEYMMQPEAGALLGVLDGLFGYISKIRQLRDRIRTRRCEGHECLLDYNTLDASSAIDENLRDWVCTQEEGTPRWIASQLYRTTTWLYLYRTIQASEPSEMLRRGVDEGLELLESLPSDSSTQSILLMPTFLLGCSAFHEYQRPAIRQSFQALHEYSSLGNIKYARAIVEKVWEMMDAGDSESWDGEGIIQSMGWDFLIT